METGAITSYIDVAQVVLYAFWVFFALLVIYLQRESRREGYPLVSELDGKPLDHGVIWVPSPKTFLLADGTTVTVPQREKDLQPPALAPLLGANGSAYVPTGNPMLAGVGPGAWTPRANVPDVTHEGHLRIVPLRAAPGISLEEREADPRGMAVFGADGLQSGEVVDIWVDRSDNLARYFEVELTALPPRPAQPLQDGEEVSVPGPRTVLLPTTFTRINGIGRRINVQSILASQFADVPGIAYPDVVTLNEEERICAYYGGGYLYATPQRQETLL